MFSQSCTNVGRVVATTHVYSDSVRFTFGANVEGRGTGGGGRSVVLCRVT